MTRKRACFASSVCCSDSFADLSHSAQALYTQLGFEADSDGAVGNVRRVMRSGGFTVEHVAELVAAGLLIEVSDVHVVTHWWVNNNRDRCNYRPGDHQDVMKRLELGENRVYRLVTAPQSGNSLTEGLNQSDVSLQYQSMPDHSIPSQSSPEKPREANPIKENPSERAYAGARARCPQCGAECAVAVEGGVMRGWCPSCDLDFTEQ